MSMACMQVAPRLSASELMQCTTSLLHMEFGGLVMLLPEICDAMKERLMESALSKPTTSASRSINSTSASSATVPATAILKFLSLLNAMSWPVPPQTAALIKQELADELLAKASASAAGSALELGYGGADLDGAALGDLLAVMSRLEVEVDPPLLQVRY